MRRSLVILAKTPISLATLAQAGYYYNVVTPEFGADSQFRFQIVLLFPK